MDNPGTDGEELCNTEPEEETSLLQKKRSRRVSFADTTSVHVFDRDEDFETPPDSKPNSDNVEELGNISEPGKVSAGEEDDDSSEAKGDCEADDVERFVLEMVSPGSVNGSATSNDEDKFFGPVSTSFIRSRAFLDSPAADDITLDSTAFSMQFGKLMQSGEISKTSSGFRLSSDYEKTPTEDSAGTTSGSRMLLTNDKKVENSPTTTNQNFGERSVSNEMSLVTDEPMKYDYTKLSPKSDALLAEYYKYFPTSLHKLPKLDNQINDSVDSSIKHYLKRIHSISREVGGGKLYNTDHGSPRKHTPVMKSLSTEKPSSESLHQLNGTPERNHSGNHMETAGDVPETNQSNKQSSDVTGGVIPDVMGLVDQELQRNEPLDSIAFRCESSSQLSPARSVSVVWSSQSTDRQGYLSSSVNDEKLKSNHSGSGEAGISSAGLSPGGRTYFPEQGDEAVFSAGKSGASVASKREQCHQICESVIDGHHTWDKSEDNFLERVRVITSPDSGQHSPIYTPKLDLENGTPLSQVSSLFSSRKHLLLNDTFSPSCNIEISTPFSGKARRELTDVRVTSTEDKKMTTPYAVATLSHTNYGVDQSTPGFSFSGTDHPVKVVRSQMNESMVAKQVKPSNAGIEMCSLDIESDNTQCLDGLRSHRPNLVERKLESLSGQFVKQGSLNDNAEVLAATPVSYPRELPGDVHQLSLLENSKASLKASNGHSHLFKSTDGLDETTQNSDLSEVQKCPIDVGHSQTTPSNQASFHNLSLRNEDMNFHSDADPNLFSLKALDMKGQSPYSTPESHKQITLPKLLTKSPISKLPVENLHDESIPSVHIMGFMPEFDYSERKRKNIEVPTTERWHRKKNNEGVVVVLDNQSKELSHCSEDQSYVMGSTKKGNESTRIQNDAFSMSDIFGQVQSFPVSKVRYKDLRQLEDMLEELQKVTKYRRLSVKIHPQKMLNQMGNSKLQRIAEARLLWLELVYEKTKFHIMQVKHDMLHKSIQQLQLGVQECQKLKLIPLQNPSMLGANAQSEEAQTPSSSADKMALHRVEMLRRELGSLDQKMKKLVESLHKCCKIKGGADPDETLLLANDYVKNKTCCIPIQQDLQLWKLDDIDTIYDKHTIFLKYGDFLKQRFSVSCGGPSSSIQTFYSIHDSNIDKMFPSMKASSAFHFIFGADCVRYLQGPTCIQQEAQFAGHLLGNLLDVLEEVQLARMEIPYLLHANFDCPAAGKLELCLCFIDCNMEQKATLVLNVTELKCAVYPSEVIPSKLCIQSAGMPRSKSLLSSEMMDAIQNLRSGHSRIIRICQVVSQHFCKSNS